jgi:Fe-S-cluster-containing dehydrogenase component
MKAFTIDVARCNGCYNCQVACKDEHCGNDWAPYARPQPETGQFWLKLNEFIRGTVPKVKMHYLPVLCMHCQNAACKKACPVSGAIYQREDGLVIIDPAKCTGCRNCVDACPYGAIYFNENLNLAQKCTGCAHLLDSGWKEPRCVDACPTEALKMVDESEIAELKKKAEILHPDRNTQPRVYYSNIPQKFVAGTVYDPVIKEVIVGASCALENIASRERITVKTDGFGDFWFEKLSVGRFSLTIENKGRTKVISPIDTEKDVNLGDIAFP